MLWFEQQGVMNGLAEDSHLNRSVSAQDGVFAFPGSPSALSGVTRMQREKVPMFWVNFVDADILSSL